MYVKVLILSFEDSEEQVLQEIMQTVRKQPEYKREKPVVSITDSTGFFISFDCLAFVVTGANDEPLAVSPQLPVPCSHSAASGAFGDLAAGSRWLDRKSCRMVSSNM